MPSAIYERFNVVVVPFPFTDRATSKRRPAVVLSSGAFNGKAGHSVMAMITSVTDNSWPQDVAIQDLRAAGLTVSCCVRFKLFTLDNRLVLRKAGTLSQVDAAATESALRAVLAATR
jgi:mRNA interferase MazF